MPSQALTEQLLRLLGILLNDLILSGDNALVIGVIASRFQGWRKWMVLIVGGGAAILLRILFTVTANYLLQVPGLRTVGSLILLVIGARFILEYKLDGGGGQATANQLRSNIPGSPLLMAILEVLLADVATSLDNILAIAGLAHNNPALIVIGLLVSIPLVLAGAGLVSSLVSRFPWATLVAAILLAWSAAGLILEDSHFLPGALLHQYGIIILAMAYGPLAFLS